MSAIKMIIDNCSIFKYKLTFINIRLLELFDQVIISKHV